MTRVRTLAAVVWMETLRRKDLYVLLILLLALLAVLTSVNVFGLGAVARYMLDVGLLFAWLFSIVLATGVAARQLPHEEARGTIYPLLAKPILRSELLVGKWVGVWTAAAAATGMFYLAVLLAAAARGGTVQAGCLAQALALHLTGLGCVTALAIAFSTRMTSSAAAAMTYVVTGAAFLLGPRVPELLAHESGFHAAGLLFAYYALPHLELFDLRQRLVHDWGPVPWGTALGIIGYGAIWIALLLLAGWLAYRGKRFRRGYLG